jgi:hypothetical protein
MLRLCWDVLHRAVAVPCRAAQSASLLQFVVLLEQPCSLCLVPNSLLEAYAQVTQHAVQLFGLDSALRSGGVYVTIIYRGVWLGQCEL